MGGTSWNCFTKEKKRRRPGVALIYFPRVLLLRRFIFFVFFLLIFSDFVVMFLRFRDVTALVPAENVFKSVPAAEEEEQRDRGKCRANEV